jgi:hypothetical protein
MTPARTLAEIAEAKAESARARSRFEATLAGLQRRLRPGNLAEEAWDGVKDKGAELADGALQAAKKRPIAVSAVLGAFALFLARDPLKRAVSRIISNEDGATGNEPEDAESSVTEGVD